MIDLVVSSDAALKISLLEAWTTQEIDRQKEVLFARRYHEGDQDAELTERLEEYLGDPLSEFRLNASAKVITAVSERLSIDGFDCEDMTVLDWLEELWRKSGLDAMQDEVHEGALRDGEYFMIVDWDEEAERPRFIPHARYTSVEAGGDGYGCLLFYEEDDPNQTPQVGLKQWTERAGNDIFERRNLYYPDRIEKWIRDAKANWRIVEVVDWLDETGEPLGIAVKHFKNKRIRPEAADAYPLQRATNKVLLDLLSASDLTAFRIFVSLGFIPTTDGGAPASDRSNWLKVAPGQIVGTTKPPQDASFSAIDTAELTPLMDLTQQLILWMAMVTDTPVTRFVSTKLVASDETLKEQEGPLLARVHNRQVSFGNTWVECMQLAIRLQNAFGTDPTGLDAETVLDPIWIEAQSRSQAERLDLLLKKQKLGIPKEQLWREAGYSAKRIEQMKSMAAEAAEEALELMQERQQETNQSTEESDDGQEERDAQREGQEVPSRQPGRPRGS